MTRVEVRTAIQDALRAANIYGTIEGCGCCGSPSFELVINGERVRGENLHIDTMRPKASKVDGDGADYYDDDDGKPRQDGILGGRLI